MSFLRLTVIASSLLAITACSESGAEPHTETRPNDWLLNQDSDSDRFQRLQSQFGGFSQSMWEVGDRYERLHDAISRENYDLALYQWEAIGAAVERGVERRPGRATNSQALFLDRDYDAVRELLEERTLISAWAGFERADRSCRSCHQAERVEYFNNQAMFDLRAPQDYRD